jgi:hypothetical protein
MSNTKSLSLAEFLAYFPSPLGCLRGLAVVVLLPLGLLGVGWPYFFDAMDSAAAPLDRVLTGKAAPDVVVVSGPVAAVRGTALVRAPQSREAVLGYRAILRQGQWRWVTHKAHWVESKPRRTWVPEKTVWEEAPVDVLVDRQAVPFEVRDGANTYVVRQSATEWRIDPSPELPAGAALPAWANGKKLKAPLATGKAAGAFKVEERLLHPGDVVTVIGRKREAGGETTLVRSTEGLWVLKGSLAEWRYQRLSFKTALVEWPRRVGMGCLAVLVVLHLPWGRLRRRRTADAG